MRPTRLCVRLVLVALGVTVARPAGADETKAPARCEARVEMRAAGPGREPRVRMWVNGREVEPGEPIGVGGGKARVRIQAVPAGRRRDDPAAGRALLGVHVAPLGDDLAREVGVERGVAVTGVVEGSPARRAGLREGDVITAVDGHEVRSPTELVERIGGRRPGERVRIEWRRPGARIEATVALAGREEPAPEEGRRLRPRDEGEREARRGEQRRREEAEEADRERPPGGFLGILAAPLNDDIREIAGTDEGVLINSLTDDSPAAKAGLLPGDVIVRIGDADVHGVDQLVETLRGRKPGERVHVVYYREGKRRETDVTLGRRPGDEEEEAEQEDFPLFDELFGGEVPSLRDYLKRLRPEMEEWARQFREQREWPEMRRPEPRPREPYGMGKDLGRIVERLDRIERRLDRIEERLERAER